MHNPSAMHESYGVLLGYMDHAPAIRLGTRSTFCGARIDKVRGQFKRQCQEIAPRNRSKDFYEPQFATTFGHWDDLVLLLVDDAEASGRLVSGAPQIEKHSLAIPYNREFLAGHSGYSLAADPRSLVVTSDNSAQKEAIKCPLISVTHIKLGGILTMAFGTHAQTSAASLIANRIQTVTDTFCEALGNSNDDSPAEFSEILLRDKHSTLFNRNDFRSARFSILDTLASEDLIILARCNNYSVVATVLAAIRKLTLRDLLDYSSRSEETFSLWFHQDEIFENAEPKPLEFLYDFAALSSGQPQQGGFTKAELLSVYGGNHLISGSCTTFGVTDGIANLSEKATYVHGRVLAHGDADVNPGHEIDAENALDYHRNRAFGEEPSIDSGDEWHFVMPGRHDYRFDFSPGKRKPGTGTIRTASFLSFFEKLFESPESTSLESGFQDLSTVIAVPIPKIGKIRQKDSGIYSRLKSLIEPDCSVSTHVDTMAGLEAISEHLRVRFRLDAPRELEKSLGALGLSPSARSSITRQIADFIAAMRDPLLYDTVVDMVDAYDAFFNFVNAVARHLASLPDRHRFATKLNFRRFAIDFAKGMKQAHALRVSNSTAKHEEWHAELGGSFANLVSAGDTALKCSMAILRQRLYPSVSEFRKARSRVTGVVCPGLNQRSVASFTRLEQLTLAIISIDSAHIFRPELLARILHEAAHLYFQRLVCGGVSRMETVLVEGGMNRAKLSNDVCESAYLRASEVFSDLFVFEYIFDCEFELFLTFQICMLNSDVGECVDTPKCDTASLANASMENLYRLFLTTHYARAVDVNSHIYQDSKAAHSEKFLRFTTSVKDRLDVFSEVDIASFQRLANGFANVLYEQSMILCRFLSKAMSDANNSFRFAPHEINGRRQRYSEFYSQQKPSLDLGLPIPLFQPSQKIDEGQTVFNLISYYVRESQVSLEPRYRGLEKVEEYLATEQERRKEFRQFTVVFKSLWHISCRQRRRRFHDLIRDALTSGSSKCD